MSGRDTGKRATGLWPEAIEEFREAVTRRPSRVPGEDEVLAVNVGEAGEFDSELLELFAVEGLFASEAVERHPGRAVSSARNDFRRVDDAALEERAETVHAAAEDVERTRIARTSAVYQLHGADRDHVVLRGLGGVTVVDPDVVVLSSSDVDAVDEDVAADLRVATAVVYPDEWGERTVPAPLAALDEGVPASEFEYAPADDDVRVSVAEGHPGCHELTLTAGETTVLAFEGRAPFPRLAAAVARDDPDVIRGVPSGVLGVLVRNQPDLVAATAERDDDALVVTDLGERWYFSPDGGQVAVENPTTGTTLHVDRTGDRRRSVVLGPSPTAVSEAELDVAPAVVDREGAASAFEAEDPADLIAWLDAVTDRIVAPTTDRTGDVEPWARIGSQLGDLTRERYRAGIAPEEDYDAEWLRSAVSDDRPDGQTRVAPGDAVGSAEVVEARGHGVTLALPVADAAVVHVARGGVTTDDAPDLDEAHVSAVEEAVRHGDLAPLAVTGPNPAVERCREVAREVTGRRVYGGEPDAPDTDL